MESMTDVKKKIYEGVNIVLSNWEVLQRVLAEGIVQKNFAVIKESVGPDSVKKEALQGDDAILKAFTKELTNYIYDYDVDEGYISDFIYDYVEKNFFVDLDETRDVQFIAKTLNDLNYTVSRDDDSVYKKLLEYDEKARQNKPKFDKKLDSDDEDEDYSSEGDDEEEKVEEGKGETAGDTQEKDKAEANQNKEPEQPLVDEDGFVLVAPKRGKKKHKRREDVELNNTMKLIF